MNLEKRQKEIKVRLTEIKGLTELEATLEVLEELEAEVDELTKEESEIERKLAIMRKADFKPLKVEDRSKVDSLILLAFSLI